MSPQEDVAVNESVSAHIDRGATVPERIKVRVTAEVGLFKNGQHYPKGSELEMPFETAKLFAAIKEVEGVA